MSDKDQQIEVLKQRIDRLVATQIDFQKEISLLRTEIDNLSRPQTSQQQTQQPPRADVRPTAEKPPPPKNDLPPRPTDRGNTQSPPPMSSYQAKPKRESTIDIERFIGENLLSKIGIVVLILGVGIGLKYAIDNGWVTPIMRVTLAYLTTAVLAAVALKVKDKYLTFSSVLVSGAVAVGYFTTYFAYSEYHLLPQVLTFVLMTVCTGLAVATALLYSRQIIAHIGLVGAYAVPFLLSTGSANYGFLFSYIALINLGILAICVYKYWKPLFYTSFIFTWIIYLAWLGGRFEHELHREMAFIFLGNFFLTFQLIFIIYKTRAEEEYAAENITLVASNSVLLFSIGSYLLSDLENVRTVLAGYSVINAVIHLMFAFAVNALDKGKKQLDSIFIVLVLTFASAAIAIKFDGNTRTVLFALEGLFLFALGRVRAIPIFEYYSYLISAIGLYSLLWDWQEFAGLGELNSRQISRSESNAIFITAAGTGISFAAIFAVNRLKNYAPPMDEIRSVVKYVALLVIAFIAYNIFRLEIATYYSNVIAGIIAVDQDVSTTFWSMKSMLWQFNYTIFYAGILWLINELTAKDKYALGAISLVQIVLTVSFAVFGQIFLFEMQDRAEPQFIFGYFVGRYAAIALILLTIGILYKASRSPFWSNETKRVALVGYDIFAAVCFLLLANGEVILWTEQLGIKESYKFALSILWGGYALLLVVVGMIQNKNYLRFMAFGLFGITLIKLFFYDTANLGTIEKTLLFMVTGALLLVGAYLYNRFARSIFSTDEKDS